MRVMPDSNTVFSAIAFPNSVPDQAVQIARTEHTLVLSSYVLSELFSVFSRKRTDCVVKLTGFLDTAEYELFNLPENWRDDVDIPYIRDPKDEEVLASAILSCCDILITGDKDFDDISVPNLMIMKPRDFWDWSEGLKQ